MSNIRRLSDAEYDALKKTLVPWHLAIIEQAEKDCADKSLTYDEVCRRAYQWAIGIRFTLEILEEYAVLRKLLREVFRRAGELRGVKFSE